jgi:amino acid adenylation domain-containing protein
MQRLEPSSGAYNVGRAVHLRGPIDMEALRRTFESIVRRHPNLRSTFELRGGQPVQLVHRSWPLPHEHHDASGWTEQELEDRLVEVVRRPFDLANETPFRLFTFVRADGDVIGGLVLHHIATDLWSLAIILYEMDVQYRAERTGVPADLRPHATRYSDYVAQQQRMLAGPEGERLRNFWLEYLDGAPQVLNLPTDRPRPATPSHRAGDEPIRFSSELSARLRALAAEKGVSLHTLALAAFEVLLARYSGQTEFLVGSPVAGRGHRVATQVGYFVNSLAVRADVGGDPTFGELLERCERMTAAAHQHGAYPFPLLVEQLAPARDPSRTPLFQVMFAWQKTTSLIDPEGLASFILGEQGGRLPFGDTYHTSVALKEQVGPFDLTLLMVEVGDELAASAGYALDLFDRATIRRLLRSFTRLLEGITEDPNRPVSAYEIVDDAERELVLGAWNATESPFPSDCCIHHLFERQVAARPDAAALVSDLGTVTYAELDRRATHVARRLRALGVGRDVLVGLCAERSVEAIVGLLGILKAGGAYVPLDPAYPAERLSHMLDDARPPVLLVPRQLEAVLPPHGATVLHLDAVAGADAEEADADADAAPLEVPGPDALAYVIYTSGSTGRPKGVLVPHRGLCNLVAAQTRAFGIVPTDRVIQFASLSFDAAVSEIFMGLTTGAALVIARQEQLFGGSVLEQLLREREVTVATLPPALLATLAPAALPKFRVLISAGEPCGWEIVARWSAPGRTIFNAYGPTEATIGPTYYRVNGHSPTTSTVPIGRPIANTRIYILDANGRPVPVGVPGELYVGGVGVARGYLNRPDLTAQRFLDDPFGAPGERMYRTGDRARWLADGNLEYLGRVDRQVKLRGFRIEPEEIEAVLLQHPSVREAAVVVREDRASERRLVAYMAPADATPATELRAWLQGRLPAHMIPASFVALERLPLTPNGKVDRKALPAPKRDRAAIEGRRPETELQRRIADLWREVLQVDEVGINDNFFDLGGHSLAAVQVHDRLQEMLGRPLSMVDLFRYPTVGALAEYLGGDGAGQQAAEAKARAEKQREALERQQRARAVMAARRPRPGGGR